MKFRRSRLSALFTVTALIASSTLHLGASQRSVIRAKDEVAPALVHVRPVKEVFRRGKREEVAVTGSGFIITPDGYVVTNEHVAGKESKYVKCVLSNKEEVEAQIVGVDKFTDIAVLKLDTDRTDLPHVSFGRSEKLEAGQTVLALGSPHGLSRSVSKGIVSVTDRNLETFARKFAPYNNWIQTDAAINPGNSGGPLVNLKGEVIGINTRRLSGAENIGFAIPIDVARQVIDEIIATGKVTRSTIGVTFQEMRSRTDDPDQDGVVIGDVSPISPAFRAGIRPGDILLAVDGAPTDARFNEELPAVRKIVADLPVGAEAALDVMRGTETLEFVVTTEELLETVGDEIEFEEWGFTLSELTPEVRRRARLSRDDTGVFVSGVQPGSLAAVAGLAQRDIVLTMDTDPITDMATFEGLYQARLQGGQRLIMLTVRRGALTQFRLIKQEASDDDSNEG